VSDFNAGPHSGRAKGHLVYLGDALGDDVIRERGELLLQLVEQLHDSDVRAVALPHRGPPSSWQGLSAGATYQRITLGASLRRISDTVIGRSKRWSPLIRANKRAMRKEKRLPSPA